MTEVLTSANEAERRGKNGPVGRGLAGELGDVSSAVGSAATSTADVWGVAEPRPVPRVPPCQLRQMGMLCLYLRLVGR